MPGKLIIRFHRDDGGAVFVEATASILVFFSLVFGVVEFSYIFYQWNAAAKAMERGARLAAVSNPVASNLKSLTGLEPGTNIPGETMPSFACACSGTTETCTGTVPLNATACTYDNAAMLTIFLGRGNNGTDCVSGPETGMCGYLPGLEKSNLVISYQYTGLGYAGRKSGPVPTITISLVNYSYDFLFLKGLAGLTSVTLPATATVTVTGEDLNAGSS